MSHEKKKIAFLFPGQGAQYPGMALDFYKEFQVSRQTFEEADDLLGRKLSKIVLEGPEASLTETRNSQTGIYVASTATLRAIQSLYPHLQPSVAGGLSLGEYTALHASGKIAFEEGLKLVDYRAKYMNDACETHPGTMVVILGMEADAVEKMVKELNMPNDLWAANFNCPGQVVISGTLKGIEAGTAAAKERGAKRVLPLQVHGAFHSGLMLDAQKRLRSHIMEANIVSSDAGLVMNVNGKIEKDPQTIRTNLGLQVTHPVRWQSCVASMEQAGVDLFIEVGCGKTLAGFNKKIGVQAPTISIEKIEDLKKFEEACLTEKLQ
jgi:[acyl-carrier-protein] S-malonyltransferase